MKVVLRAVLSVLLGANLISECFGADEPFACRSLDSKTVCQLPEGTVEVSGATTNITLDQGTNVWVGAGPQATTLMFLNNLTLPGSVVLQLVNLTLKGPHIGPPNRLIDNPWAPGLFLGPGVVTATNVVVPISCSLLSTYFTYFCTGAIARDNVKIGYNSMSLLNFVNGNKKMMAQNMTYICNPTPSDPFSPPTCTVDAVYNSDQLHSVLDNLDTLASTAASDSTSWVPASSYISIMNKMGLRAQLAQWRAGRALQNGTTAPLFTAAWPYTFEGRRGGPWASTPSYIQLDLGGDSSLSLFGTSCTLTPGVCGSVTFAFLTLTGLPRGPVQVPPYTSQPVSGATMLMWAMALPRLAGDLAALTSQGPGLFLDHVNLLVSDDELAYWAQASVGPVAAGPGVLPAIEAHAQLSDPGRIFLPTYTFTLLTLSPGGDGLTTSVSMSPAPWPPVATRRSLQQQQGPVPPQGSGPGGGPLTFPPAPVRPPAPPASLYAPGAPAPNGAGNASFPPNTTTPMLRLSLLGGVSFLYQAVNLVSTLGWELLYTNTSPPYVGASGLPLGLPLTNWSHIPPNVTLSPAQLFAPASSTGSNSNSGNPDTVTLLGPVFLEGSSAGATVTSDRSLTILGDPTDPWQTFISMGRHAGLVSIPPGSQVSLQYVTLLDLGVQPPLRQQPSASDPPPAVAPLTLGAFASLVWAFNLARPYTPITPSGTLELVGVNLVVPPSELQMLMDLLVVEEGGAERAPSTISEATRSALEEVLTPVKGTVHLVNPGFDPEGPNPSLYLPSFSPWGTFTARGLTISTIINATRLPHPGFYFMDVTDSSPQTPAPPPGAAINTPTQHSSNDADTGHSGSRSRTLGLAIGLSLGLAAVVTALLAGVLLWRRNRNFQSSSSAGKEGKGSNDLGRCGSHDSDDAVAAAWGSGNKKSLGHGNGSAQGFATEGSESGRDHSDKIGTAHVALEMGDEMGEKGQFHAEKGAKAVQVHCGLTDASTTITSSLTDLSASQFSTSTALSSDVRSNASASTSHSRPSGAGQHSFPGHTYPVAVPQSDHSTQLHSPAGTAEAGGRGAAAGVASVRQQQQQQQGSDTHAAGTHGINSDSLGLQPGRTHQAGSESQQADHQAALPHQAMHSDRSRQPTVQQPQPLATSSTAQESCVDTRASTVGTDDHTSGGHRTGSILGHLFSGTSVTDSTLDSSALHIQGLTQYADPVIRPKGNGDGVSGHSTATGSARASEAQDVNPRLEMQAAMEMMRQLEEEQQQQGPGSSQERPGVEAQVEVHSMLGRGAFGVAYRGTWRGLEVAVKRILFQLMASPQGEVSRRKAMREAAINATLNHPNVVATYSWDMVPLVANSTAPVALSRGFHDWELYIIMEYCDRGSLAQMITERALWDATKGQPDLRSILTVARHIAAGMAYLHAKHILHGDLKPDNVLLKSDPTSPNGIAAKVGDFGMSVKLGANETHASGVHHGTPLYIAPEVLHRAQAARGADVYSFGVMMWELWHGKTAWQQLLDMTDQKPAAVGMAYMPGLFTFGDGKDDIDASEITAASKISHPDPSLLPPFIDLVRGCLSERPADRPNFEAISTRLQEMLQQVQGA